MVLTYFILKIESICYLCYDETVSDQQPDKACRVYINTAFLALCRVNLTHPALYSGRKEAPIWIKSGSERFSKRSVRKRD